MEPKKIPEASVAFSNMFHVHPMKILKIPSEVRKARTFQHHGRSSRNPSRFSITVLKHNGIISVRNRKWMTCSGESLVMMTFKRICFKKIHELFLATIKLSLNTSARLEGKRGTIWTIYEQYMNNLNQNFSSVSSSLVFGKKEKTPRNPQQNDSTGGAPSPRGRPLSPTHRSRPKRWAVGTQRASALVNVGPWGPWGTIGALQGENRKLAAPPVHPLRVSLW